MLNEEPDYSVFENDSLRELLSGMLVKDSKKRMTIQQIKINDWITNYGKEAMP